MRSGPRVTDAKLFENGRHLAARIGIVPENDSTGGKVKLKGLSKKGDRYLRSLLVHRRDGRRGPGADPPGQESRGHEAARPHVGQAGGDRDRQLGGEFAGTSQVRRYVSKRRGVDASGRTALRHA